MNRFGSHVADMFFGGTEICKFRYRHGKVHLHILAFQEGVLVDVCIFKKWRVFFQQQRFELLSSPLPGNPGERGKRS